MRRRRIAWGVAWAVLALLSYSAFDFPLSEFLVFAAIFAAAVIVLPRVGRDAPKRKPSLRAVLLLAGGPIGFVWLLNETLPPGRLYDSLWFVAFLAYPVGLQVVATPPLPRELVAAARTVGRPGRKRS